jgi:hypothetical protein
MGETEVDALFPEDSRHSRAMVEKTDAAMASLAALGCFDGSAACGALPLRMTLNKNLRTVC